MHVSDEKRERGYGRSDKEEVDDGESDEAGNDNRNGSNDNDNRIKVGS